MGSQTVAFGFVRAFWSEWTNYGIVESVLDEVRQVGYLPSTQTLDRFAAWRRVCLVYCPLVCDGDAGGGDGLLDGHVVGHRVSGGWWYIHIDVLDVLIPVPNP